jgi:hypothetical protein
MPGSRRLACTTAAPTVTTIKPTIPAVTANRGAIPSTTGARIARPPVISVNPTNITVPELKSLAQLAPRSARRFLEKTNFVAPATANATPIPMLIIHKATFTYTFAAFVRFTFDRGDAGRPLYGGRGRWLSGTGSTAIIFSSRAPYIRKPDSENFDDLAALLGKRSGWWVAPGCTSHLYAVSIALDR